MMFACDVSRIRDAVTYIREELKKRKVDHREITRAMMTSEEVIRVMIEHAKSPREGIHVRVNAFMGSVSVRIACTGTAFERSELESPLYFEDDPEANAIIDNIVNRVMGYSLTLKHRGGVNSAVIQVAPPRFKQLILTVGALIAGLLTGLLLRFVLPEAANAAIAENLFTPVSTMFVNALKMVVGPLVFFSIASSIADFNDIRSLGRIAAKVMGSYCVTSVIAILIGTAVWFVFPIGDPALRGAVSQSGASVAATAQGASVSVRDTVVGIIPQDIIQPFLSVNMLQIIFLAVLVGLAAGALTNKLYVFKDLLLDGNLVFSKITAMIIGVMPAAIFCNMAKLAQSVNPGDFASVLTWIPTIYFADALMLAAYGLLILLVARERPSVFFRKFYPVMITGFTMASSNATMPSSMEVCDKKLGIPRQIYAFSLPLGATVNMDGTCITLVISALFMAKTFGVSVTPSMLLTLFISIFILSLGSPGVPGGALVCVSILLPQIGVPAEAVSLIMGIYALVGMMTACVNVTGDAAVTLITAKLEKMLDLEVYNS